MIDVENFEINVTVGNVQNMKCGIKVSVNMKLQGVKTVKIIEFMYVPQAVKKLLRVSRLVSKCTTMGDTQDKMIIEKGGVSMILDARKCKKKHYFLLEG